MDIIRYALIAAVVIVVLVIIASGYVKAKVVRPVILVVVGFVALVAGLVLAALVVRGLFVS